MSWLDPSKSLNLDAISAASEQGSWAASLRLGELLEREGRLEGALRAYAMAAERLDDELAKSQPLDRALRSYAERAFARRGSLVRYFTGAGDAAKVVAIGREVQGWARKHRR
jgi:hypothetical protein